MGRPPRVRMVEITVLAHHRGRLENGGWVHPITPKLNPHGSSFENLRPLHAHGGERSACIAPLLFGSLVSEMCLAQIELSLDSPPRLIVQLTVAKELVGPPPLGSDQQKLDLVVRLRELSMTFAPEFELF